MEMRSIRRQQEIIAGTLKRSTVKLQFEFQQITVADPVFSDGAAPGGGVNLIFAKFLPKNENERIRTQRGDSCPWHP